MNQKYKSEISEKRWIVYDVFGNIGWIAYFVFTGLLLKKEINTISVLALIPAVLMLVGILELLSERTVKLDYVLPKIRLYRGFGALMLGGICGVIFSGVVFLMERTNTFMWMFGSSVLCAVFAWLLFREYHPVKENDLSPFFKSIVDQDRASVVICNLEHEIIYMNPAAVQSYVKWGGDKLVGKCIFDCHNPKSKEAIQKVVDWFAADESHNLVHTFHNEKQNKDVYMVALRNEGKLIGYYEKHEYRNLDTMKFYDLW